MFYLTGGGAEVQVSYITIPDLENIWIRGKATEFELRILGCLIQAVRFWWQNLVLVLGEPEVNVGYKVGKDS